MMKCVGNETANSLLQSHITDADIIDDNADLLVDRSLFSLASLSHHLLVVNPRAHSASSSSSSLLLAEHSRLTV